MIRTVKDYEKLSEQYNKMIAERNSLIDDLSWYKAKVSRLERENERVKEKMESYKKLLRVKIVIFYLQNTKTKRYVYNQILTLNNGNNTKH